MLVGPTNALVVRHRPLRVYDGMHLKVVWDRSQAWPMTLLWPTIDLQGCIMNGILRPVGVEFRFSKNPFGYTSFSIERSELGGDNGVGR